jgi:AAA15 family ATPase/GTPase
VEFDLKKDESEGTRKFIALSGPLHHAVEDDGVLVVDEFEARLHPLLTQAIIDWFHSPLNPGRAQLIIATHDVHLMEPERIRRDQVWFTEKDDKGETQLYNLAEFDPQDVRPTTKFSRQYLLGLFGAVPRLALLKGDTVHV